MFKNKDSRMSYEELMKKYKDYDDIFTPIFRLKVTKDEEIQEIYQNFKKRLLDTEICTPVNVYFLVTNAFKYNNRFLRSYMKLLKIVYEEFQINPEPYISPVLYYFFYQDYGLPVGAVNQALFKSYKEKNYTIDIHAENTIHRAIMDDDIKSLISFTETPGFEVDQLFKSDLYPYYRDGLTLLELCCYHGAVSCFKYLYQELKAQITTTCLELSFLGGNPDIMGECLKLKKSNQRCLTFAIISHNIDFVTFLLNENIYLSVDLFELAFYHNIPAFFAYLDMTQNLNHCFIYSPLFFMPNLVEYLISLGADINAKSSDGETALHNSCNYVSKQMFDILISNHADITVTNRNGDSVLHRAAWNNRIDIMKYRVSKGAFSTALYMRLLKEIYADYKYIIKNMNICI
ncbi:hypothetical protein TVAG_168980 [Trichomonas vaginalis G3]|uniref:DUF3447 domain-containing protein n=1 Tax=Trichomonas vaginalis (strain ATCC PRA-98 / G3) TaxID=412133 RepID=A2EWR6_TRIV3|nr:hypothetical protein TVAG_168980 [Trichomonas vaginalis G3]|eukprot:XP_001315119.1 hypothetical protein [Trichomonas vaginalis G3]